MAKEIGQIRYYGDGNAKNYPVGLKKTSLVHGTAFYNRLPIVQLGVQTLPGMKIYINNHDKSIVVGQTGIYELNVDGMSNIMELRFDNATLSLIDSSSSNAYLIVDYIYESGD